MSLSSDFSRSDSTVLPPGSLRELIHVALPLVLSAGSLSLMNVVDRILLTWHSPDALAAAMPAGVLHWTVISVALGTVVYGNTFVAQYEGVGRRDRVVAIVWQSVYLAIVSGLALAMMAPLTPSIISWIGHHPDLQVLEADYFSVLCMGSVPFVLSSALSCFFSGRRRTSVVLWVNVASVIANAVLDWLLIFGCHGFPALGIKGAAIATVVARSLAVVLYAGLMLWGPTRTEYDFRAHARFDPELFRQLLRYGLPNGFLFLVDVAGFAVFVLLVAGLGKTEMAATSLAFNLNALAFVPLLGVGTAVMTLVGYRIGKRQAELAVRTTWTAFLISGGWMLALAPVYLFGPELIMVPYSQFTTEAEFAAIRNHVVVLLRFVATYSFFDAMLVVFSSAVREAGDTRFSMLYTCGCCWLLMVVPTWIVSTWFGGHLLASWTACTVYIVVAGLGFMARFQGGGWKSMSVIEQNLIGTDEPSSTGVPMAAVVADGDHTRV